MPAQPMLRRWVGVAMILAAFTAGCSRSSDEDAAPQATAPRASTTTSISVAEVPEKIDVAYTQAVMNALDQVTGDALRFFAADRGPNREFYVRLKAAYDESAFERERLSWGRIAAEDMGGMRDQPGNPKTTVERILDSSPNCILADATRTFEDVLTELPPPDSLAGYVQLRQKKPELDPDGLNPTPWALVADVIRERANVPEDPCKG